MRFVGLIRSKGAKLLRTRISALRTNPSPRQGSANVAQRVAGKVSAAQASPQRNCEIHNGGAEIDISSGEAKESVAEVGGGAFRARAPPKKIVPEKITVLINPRRGGQRPVAGL